MVLCVDTSYAYVFIGLFQLTDSNQYVNTFTFIMCFITLMIQSQSLGSQISYYASQKKTPWLGILTSAPVWGLSITGLCDTWGFYVLLTCMPTFIQQTLGCNKHLVREQLLKPHLMQLFFKLIVVQP